MATVQSMTLPRLLALEADTVVGGHIDGSGDLILEQHDGSTINAGSSLPAVPDATESVKGKVELATTAEATTGADTSRAVTPAGLAAAAGTHVPDATTSVKGKVELATTAEAAAMTDTTRAVTPAGLLEFLKIAYPVGVIYQSTVSTSPATLFGFGTWVAMADRVLMGASATYPAGTTGGAATKTLSTMELPAHAHSVGTIFSNQFPLNFNGGVSGWHSNNLGTGSVTSNNTGGGSAFSLLNPYVAVYMWKRTA